MTNEQSSICSPPAPNFYTTVEDILKPQTIERLLEVFYHTIYPM